VTRKVWAISWLYLKTTYTSRATFLFNLAMPLLFTFVLGQAMQNLGPSGEAASILLLVVNEDQSTLSQALIERLEANERLDVNPVERAAAMAQVENDGQTALILPAGFGDSLERGGTVEAILVQNADEISSAQLLLEAVNAAAAEISGSLAAADFSVRIADQVGLFAGAADDQRQTYRQTAFAAAEAEWQTGAPIQVVAGSVTRLESAAGQVPLGASQSSPGMLVMYVLFFTFGGGSALIVERDQGTLRRLLVMPLSKGELLSGKLAGIFLGALVQMAIMILVGQFALGVKWGQSPAGLGLMLTSYAFAATTLALMIAALARSAAQVNAAGVLVIMALASLGGAWWPIEIVPAWMQQISLALPTGWAMRGFHDLISRGLGWEAILLEVAVLSAFGLGFLLIGLRRFRY